MANRQSFIVGLCVGMAVHALVIGRYLESVFFLTAFPWAWVGLVVFRSDIKSAQTMALTMIGVMLVSTMLLLAGETGGHARTALLSLAIVPSTISWICLVLYINHSSSASHDHGPEIDAELLRASDQSRTGVLDGSYSAVARPAQWNVSAPLAPEALTAERAAQIIGAMRTQRQNSDAA